MNGLQEYDLEFKPIHIIKGHGLCQLAAEAVDAKEEEDLSRWEQEIEMYNVHRAFPTIFMKTWYIDVCQYLEHSTVPFNISAWKKRALKLKELTYKLVHGVLFINNHNGVFLRCLEAHD